MENNEQFNNISIMIKNKITVKERLEDKYLILKINIGIKF